MHQAGMECVHCGFAGCGWAAHAASEPRAGPAAAARAPAGAPARGAACPCASARRRERPAPQPAAPSARRGAPPPGHGVSAVPGSSGLPVVVLVASGMLLATNYFRQDSRSRRETIAAAQRDPTNST